jgi:hypothetical protein
MTTTSKRADVVIDDEVTNITLDDHNDEPNDDDDDNVEVDIDSNVDSTTTTATTANSNAVASSNAIEVSATRSTARNVAARATGPRAPTVILKTNRGFFLVSRKTVSLCVVSRLPTHKSS